MQSNTSIPDSHDRETEVVTKARLLIHSSLVQSAWDKLGILSTSPISKVIDPDCPDRVAYEQSGTMEHNGKMIPITFEVELRKDGLPPLLAVYPDDLNEIIHLEIMADPAFQTPELQKENFRRIQEELLKVK